MLAQHWGVTAPFWFAFVGSAIFVVLIWGQLAHIAHADEEHVEQEPPLPGVTPGRRPVVDQASTSSRAFFGSRKATAKATA